MPDSQLSYELDLARNLIQTSNLLAVQLYPETTFIPYNEQAGLIGKYRFKDPDFSKPQISIYGHDLSENLYGLAQRTNDLLMDMSVTIGELDEGLGFIPMSYGWEARSIGSMQGLLFFISCSIDLPNDPQQSLKKLRDKRSGYLELQKLLWFDTGEEIADQASPNNVMLSLIKQDSLQSLVAMHWLLDGLTKSREVYKEEVYK